VGRGEAGRTGGGTERAGTLASDPPAPGTSAWVQGDRTALPALGFGGPYLTFVRAMTLRSRIALAFLTIALILVGPAIYGLSTLWELRNITQNLRTRDAVGALALGRMQTAFGEVQHWHRMYLLNTLAGQDQARADARGRIASNVARFESELDRLAEARYGAEVARTRARWDELNQGIQSHALLLDAGQLDLAERFEQDSLAVRFAGVAATLDPIGQAINRAGEEQAERAESLATRAASTTLIALAIAVLLAVLVAGWLARSLLRPINELRRGMSVVAAGDFEPELRVDPGRPDELGDLARSFDRMTQQLTELDRLKAEFVSVASHELKTPLSVIKGYVGLLQEGIYGPLDEKQVRVLTSVSDQTDRLGRLIQQLLDISRFEAGGHRLDLKQVELRPFLAELATSFEALAVQNRIDFRLEAENGLPDSVRADPDRLNEVVGNLLSNAFKFTPREGQIRLRAESLPDGLVLEVRDTGIGIPAGHLARIFEKFYQVENSVQPKSIGSGLGLAISKEIVEAHGGTIAAESEEGRGTTFRVVLPIDEVSA
jgi:signal transduction histidine kinase